MPQSEVLTLIATATDRASPALRQIQRAITELNKAGVDLNKQSTALEHLNKAWTNLGTVARKSRDDQKHIREYGDRFKELGERGRRVAEVATKDILPAFSGINIGAITATGAIVALGEATQKFAEQSNRMGNFAKGFGYAVKDLQGLTGAAREVEISSDTITNSLAQVSREMDKVRGMAGQGGMQGLLNQLRAQPGGQGAAFDIQNILGTKNLPVEQQNIRVFMRLLQEARRIAEQPGPRGGAAYAGSFLEQHGMDRNLLRLTEEGMAHLEERMKRQAALQGLLDPAKAHAYAVAQAEMNSALIGLQTAIGGELIGDLTKLTQQITAFLEANNKSIGEGVAKTIRSLADAVKELAPVAHFIGETADALNRLKEAGRESNKSGEGVWFNLPKAIGGPIGETLAGGDRNFGDYSSPLTTGGIGEALRSTTPQVFGSHPARQVTTEGLRGGKPQLGFSDLLHAMHIPGFATGAQEVTEGGLAVLHQGEQVRPAQISSPYSDMRRSDNVEDNRLVDNTRETAANTEQLRRLIEIIRNSMQFAPTMGGFGSGGTGAYGAGQGPMFRPGGGGGQGIGPGTSQGRGPAAPHGPVTTPSMPSKETMPKVAPTPPGAKVTPGPTGGKLTTPPPSSIPSPENMPKLRQMADGGLITAPSIVVNQKTGQPTATVAEYAPEYVVPPDQIQRLGDQPYVAGGPAAAVRYNNPAAQWPNQRSTDLYYGSSHQLTDAQRNKIAGFPTPILGMASNIDLYKQKYIGQTINAANYTWSGHHRSTLPGYEAQGNTVVTAAMMDDPDFAVPYMKAMLNAETTGSRPLSDAGFKEAYDISKAGGYDNWYAATQGGKQPLPGGAGAGQGPGPQGWPVYPGVMAGGAPRLGPDGKPITGGTTEYGASPRHMGAELQFGDKTYNVGSGGHANYNAIPYGTYEITPAATGPIIKSLGGMTLQNNQFMDPVRNRMTAGIAIHPAGTRGQENITDGCVGFNNQDWNQIKPGIQDALKQGPQYLSVTPKGMRISGTGQPYTTPGAPGEWDKFPKAAGRPSFPTSPTESGLASSLSPYGLGGTYEKPPAPNFKSPLADMLPSSVSGGYGSSAAPSPAPASRGPANLSPTAMNPEAARASLAPPDVGALGGLGEHPVGSLDKSAMTHKVEGSGKIDVNVAAPKGTSVKASSGGMFNTVKVNRQSSMPHVDEQH